MEANSSAVPPTTVADTQVTVTTPSDDGTGVQPDALPPSASPDVNTLMAESEAALAEMENNVQQLRVSQRQAAAAHKHVRSRSGTSASAASGTGHSIHSGDGVGAGAGSARAAPAAAGDGAAAAGAGGRFETDSIDGTPALSSPRRRHADLRRIEELYRHAAKSEEKKRKKRDSLFAEQHPFKPTINARSQLLGAIPGTDAAVGSGGALRAKVLFADAKERSKRKADAVEAHLRSVAPFRPHVHRHPGDLDPEAAADRLYAAVSTIQRCDALGWDLTPCRAHRTCVPLSGTTPPDLTRASLCCVLCVVCVCACVDCVCRCGWGDRGC